MTRQPFLCQYIDLVQDEPVVDHVGDILAKRSMHNNISDRVVLIITDNFDPEANVLGIGLRIRGIDFVRINTGDLSSKTRVRCTINNFSDCKVEFDNGYRLIDFSSVSAVLLRNFDLQKTIFCENSMTNIFSYQQWTEAFQILQTSLKCPWINSVQATQLAGNRARQLSIAMDAGFEIPSTLITNDPQAAHSFYDLHDGEIVIKALHHHNIEFQGKIYSMYTRKICKQDLPKLNDLVHAPCILQNKLKTKSELRVTVVGDQAFAVEMDPYATVKEYDDIHRCVPVNFPMRVFNLQDTIREKCINLVKSLGLLYGAIDFVIDKNGSLVFLEVNPTGDWYYFEHTLSLPITKAMIDLIEKIL